MGNFTDRCNVITGAFYALRAIDDDAALKKADLSVTDYWECRRLMPLLGAFDNSEVTIYEKAAAFFKRYGYKVENEGIGFRISA